MVGRIHTYVRDLRYRIALCSMQDVVIDGDTMELTRKSVSWQWAKIEGRRTSTGTSFTSAYGYAVMEKADRLTHIITIRMAAGLNITSAAWVYELPRKTPPRWYKIVGTLERGAWHELWCHLVERSDAAQPPVDNGLQAQPTRGVRL